MTPKQVRNYVKNVLYLMLEQELEHDTHLNPREGWMFGGFEQPQDAAKIIAIETEVRRAMKGLL